MQPASEGQNKMIQLGYCFFSIPHPHPQALLIESVFLLRDLRGPVRSPSLLIDACFPKCLRLLAAKQAAVCRQDAFTGWDADATLALLICDFVLCCLLLLPVTTSSQRMCRNGAFVNLRLQDCPLMFASRYRHHW